jgi:carbamoylphosphate synthase large subunit
MTDSFKTALEAALDAKKQVVTDKQRIAAVEMLAQSAMDDAADRARLIEVMGVLGMENPEQSCGRAD